MTEVDWDERARRGTGWQSVIDPADRSGLKNALIDRIQWNHVGPWARQRRAVLDYGCGIGRFAERIGALGASYVGVDTSAEMIDAARRLHAGRPARFLHVPALPMPLETARFDGCLSVGVLQCLHAPGGAALREACGELARVVALGGELLMIEQASASGRHSGSVSNSTSEQDYVDALSPWFDVVGRRRVRAGALSRASSAYARRGAGLPLRNWILAMLARHEGRRIQSADADELRQLDYYDVAIRAVRRAEQR